MKIENIEEKYEWKETNITETDLGWLGRAWADHSFIFLGTKPNNFFNSIIAWLALDSATDQQQS